MFAKFSIKRLLQKNGIYLKFRRNMFNVKSDVTEQTIFKFNSVMPVLFGVAGIYFASRSICLEAWLTRFYPYLDKDGKQIAMKRRFQEQLYTYLEEANISHVYKSMDLSFFYFSKRLEPSIHSGYLSRFGVWFGLPIYLNYFFDNPNDEESDLNQFIEHFQLDRDRLSDLEVLDGEVKPMIEQLKSNLELSENGRRFLIYSLFHTASTPFDPFFHTISLALFPLGGYALAKRYSRNIPTQIGGIIFGYLISAATIVYMNFIQQRYGYWSTFKFESLTSEEGGRDEMVDKRIPREDLYNGGKEYLEKLKKLQMIIKKYQRTDIVNKKTPDNQNRLYSIDERLYDLERFAKSNDEIKFNYLF
ncbi:hypothetical protein BLOT_015386 [Blomia tropicalis]|nr:hypothetical protein BLOT_015386 [Blomia tropicalis]